MSRTTEENRGQDIIPSARKSIHSHCNLCKNHNIKMGRYGTKVNERKRELLPSTTQQGNDEVDNVMSKMAEPISPLTIRRNLSHRRNSVDNINNEFSEDESDDKCLHSKSIPASFSYYSAQQNELCNSSDRFSYSPNMYPERVNRNNSHNTSYQQKGSKKFNINYFIPVFGIILGYLTYTLYYSYPIGVNKVYDQFSFNNELENLEEKYKIKDKFILQVRTGVAAIFEKQDTGSFIFTYNSENSNFNPLMFNKFMEDLAATASKYLRNESREVHVVVDSSNLMMQSVKEFMDQYQEAVDKTGVMLVKDIDNIPSALAMAFHYYCDEYNPLVKKSAIFFTLNLAKCSQQPEKPLHAHIENCLAKKWISVGEDKIRPLLTRVVNIIVDVTGTF